MIQFHLIVAGHLCLDALRQIGSRHLLNFCNLHILSSVFVVIPSNYKLGRHRKLLCSQTQCLLCNLVADALNLKDNPARGYREYISYWITLTLTHSDICRFLRDWLVRENTYPTLSLALHITSHRNTSSLNLAGSNPMGIKALDTETAKRQLIATLGIAFAGILLWPSVFGSFWL